MPLIGGYRPISSLAIGHMGGICSIEFESIHDMAMHRDEKDKRPTSTTTYFELSPPAKEIDIDSLRSEISNLGDSYKVVLQCLW
jgi:hypothetical protein